MESLGRHRRLHGGQHRAEQRQLAPPVPLLQPGDPRIHPGGLRRVRRRRREQGPVPAGSRRFAPRRRRGHGHDRRHRGWNRRRTGVRERRGFDEAGALRMRQRGGVQLGSQQGHRGDERDDDDCLGKRQSRDVVHLQPSFVRRDAGLVVADAGWSVGGAVGIRAVLRGEATGHAKG